ncbi:MFS transporter [Pseudomonas sp. YJ42]|uniref:MFS transporter n=1 Tax=Pseudomonas sp. YJ42 TaxID=3392115 RepID=UPI0039A08265
MNQSFFGRKVVAAAFVTALLGWGIGFYGPPIFLYSVIQRTGWSVQLCSAAVTVHFLAGTLVVVNLPRLYKRFGIPRITALGSLLLSLGVYGWSIAREPNELFIAATLSGLGWVTLGAAAINAIIAPWFVTKRPAALAMAYNGASIGGVVFSSAWVYLINQLGFSQTALLIGVLTISTIGCLSLKVFGVLPEHLGQHADGAEVRLAELNAPPIASAISLWSNPQFVTLAAGMSLGLFAQIGLIAHMFLLLAPYLTEQQSGLAMGLATASAIAGRFLVGWCMPANANRRTVACISYASQLAGCLIMAALHTHPILLWIGIAMFGAGIGNATSVPPLIAQAEFPKHQTQRVIALIVATSQGCYAFAPGLFGILTSLTDGPGSAMLLFGFAAVLQAAAILVFMLGDSSTRRKNMVQRTEN